MISTLLFYMFSGILIGSAIMVVRGKNPVHSVLFLILSFLNAAGLFLLAGAEFLAITLVIVYVGAVAVLFLFVVMMLDIGEQDLSKGFAKYKWGSLLIGIILASELITTGILWSSHPHASKEGTQPILESITNTHAIGQVLYTDYVFIFQLAGIILLVAMIGAIVLTYRTRTSAHRQNHQEQLKRSPANSLKIVKVIAGQGIQNGEGK